MSLEPIPIQVVFQGGGAKLCLLMAVCDKLKEYHDNGNIIINRVAGSSAGAIAATMLASGKSLDVYKTRLKDIGRDYLEKMATPAAKGLWNVFWGHPYFKNIDLAEFFEKLICVEGGPRFVNDLNAEALLYHTALYALRAKSASPNEALPKALEKSCRFPFAFVGFNSGVDAEVDGGLALNLPVDELMRDESKKGSVIGISFFSAFGSRDKSRLLSYTQQLFSAAIQGGVDRSEAMLGENNLFRIDTEIGTFDFDHALNEGLEDQYELALRRFDDWFKDWLEKYGPVVEHKPDRFKMLIRPALSPATIPPSIIREIDQSMKTNPCTHAISVAAFDTAILDDHGNFQNRYRSGVIMEFRIVRPTNVMQFSFQVGRGTSFAGAGLGAMR